MRACLRARGRRVRARARGRGWAWMGVDGRAWAGLGVRGRAWACVGGRGRAWACVGVRGRAWAGVRGGCGVRGADAEEFCILHAVRSGGSSCDSRRRPSPMLRARHRRTTTTTTGGRHTVHHPRRLDSVIRARDRHCGAQRACVAGDADVVCEDDCAHREADPHQRRRRCGGATGKGDERRDVAGACAVEGDAGGEARAAQTACAAGGSEVCVCVWRERGGKGGRRGGGRVMSGVAGGAAVGRAVGGACGVWRVVWCGLVWSWAESPRRRTAVEYDAGPTALGRRQHKVADERLCAAAVEPVQHLPAERGESRPSCRACPATSAVACIDCGEGMGVQARAQTQAQAKAQAQAQAQAQKQKQKQAQACVTHQRDRLRRVVAARWERPVMREELRGGRAGRARRRGGRRGGGGGTTATSGGGPGGPGGTTHAWRRAAVAHRVGRQPEPLEGDLSAAVEDKRQERVRVAVGRPRREPQRRVQRLEACADGRGACAGGRVDARLDRSRVPQRAAQLPVGAAVEDGREPQEEEQQTVQVNEPATRK